MVGLKTLIANKFMKKLDRSKKNKNIKIQQIIGILKFILTLDDREIIISSIEAIVEMLEEEIS